MKIALLRTLSSSCHPGRGKSRVSGVALIFTALMALFPVFSILARAQTEATASPPLLWSYECVTCIFPPSSTHGYYVSVGIDPQGYGHLFYDSSVNGLTMAYQSAGGWNFSLVDNSCSLSRNLFLGVETNGYEQVFYQCDDRSIRYGYRDAGGWHTQTVLQAADFVWGLLPAQTISITALALDAANQPHGLVQALFNQETSLIYYVHLSSGEWQKEAVGPGEDGDLALGPNGLPFIARVYRTWELGTPQDGFLELSYRDPYGWHVEEVAHPPQGLNVAMAIDSTGQPHIVTNGGAAPGNYYWKSATSWNAEAVMVGDSPVLLLNPQDLPSISSNNSVSLMYAIRQPEGWRSGGVGNLAFASRPGMAMDSRGNIFFAYSEANTHYVVLVRPYTGSIYTFYMPTLFK